MTYQRPTMPTVLLGAISAGLFAALNARLAVALAGEAADAGAALAMAPEVLLVAGVAALGALIRWAYRA